MVKIVKGLEAAGQFELKIETDTTYENRSVSNQGPLDKSKNLKKKMY